MATFGNLETDVELLASLMRDHEEVHGLAEQVQEAIEAALARPGEPGLASAAIELVRDLDAYLTEDLVIHIAKEEDVLFPALLGFAADLDQVVDEMVEQHDEVRARAAAIAGALSSFDREHRDVEAAKSDFAKLAASAGELPGADGFKSLLDAVKRLDWIFRGHFGDEEDDLFVPALDLLGPEVWPRLAMEAKTLEAERFR